MKRPGVAILGFMGFCIAIFTYLHFSSPSSDLEVSLGSQDSAPRNQAAGITNTDEGSNRISKSREKRSEKSQQRKSDSETPAEFLDDERMLNEEQLKALGLSNETTSKIIEAYNRNCEAISNEIALHFLSHCTEVQTEDGSYIYVLQGDPILASKLETRMQNALTEAVGSGSKGSELANQIIDQMRGKLLLNFGSDDMIAAAYRGLTPEGKWADGILINATTPGMIDYYREHGWPAGEDIHQSTGRAVFHPIEKP
ncbi:MAG: hypothetical protein MUF13_00995 [Akkermansiaceae bacterium]|jgi:hypothetical protein|nr:hypothetical protein [Akkermansiaceae bacterium]